MLDQLEEIFTTLKKNKLRTTLTGLSVSWGIFILILLLGAGNGLKNGVMSNFAERAINRITLWAGTTSMPYKGLKSERNLHFREKEVELIENQLPEADKISPRANRTQTISYGKEYGSYTVMGVMPDYFDVEKLEIERENGRFINLLDINNLNKVIVIDKKIADLLFSKESPIGKQVKVGSLSFRVIGVNTKKRRWGSPNAYIPFSTYQIIFNPEKKMWRIDFTVNGLETKAQNETFTEDLRKKMASSMNFNPEDKQAIWINNAQREYTETKKIFGGITLFVTIIGIFTLIAGIVGVSNIMLVSVKERTREIGIRKAIGAPPLSILKSIILESLIITAIFGYIGMLLGIGITEIINFMMEQQANAQAATEEVQMSVFKNPTVNLGYALFATVVLVISGMIAGYLPARKAVKIKPIEAMREE